MRRLVVLQHAPHEGPSRVQSAFERAGFTSDVLRLDLGVQVPDTTDAMDALLVLGGSMGVGDVRRSGYPFLGPEIALLERAVERDFPTLGICLGAQLLARAAGASVYPNKPGHSLVREVGWGAVHFTRSAGEEPVLAGLDAAESCSTGMATPSTCRRGATFLASTLHCPNQMFRLKNATLRRAIPPGIRRADIANWIEADAEYIEGALGPTGAARIAADTKRYMPRFRERGDRCSTTSCAR